jgi:hypothetical protein
LQSLHWPGTDPRGRQTVPGDTLLNKGALKLHSRLRKAESSVLVQARTGRIGLARFLFNHKVSGIESAKCRCKAREEAPWHMALYYLLAGEQHVI